MLALLSKSTLTPPDFPVNLAILGDFNEYLAQDWPKYLRHKMARIKKTKRIIRGRLVLRALHHALWELDHYERFKKKGIEVPDHRLKFLSAIQAAVMDFSSQNDQPNWKAQLDRHKVLGGPLAAIYKKVRSNMDFSVEQQMMQIKLILKPNEKKQLLLILFQ